MRIRINKPGMLSTVQDRGRWAYLSQAVPVSGAMDSLAARLGNVALGNHQNAAVIEFTFANAELEAETDILIAWSGEGALLMAGKQHVPSERPVFVPAGTVIKLVNNHPGSRTYLAVAGGWDVPEVLASRSTYVPAAIGGLGGRALQPGDKLQACALLTPITQQILRALKVDRLSYPGWSIARRLLLPADRNTIRIVPGNEQDWFEEGSLNDFLTTPYTLSVQCNRMGYRLEGAAIKRRRNGELLSTAVTPGTVQVTGSGAPVLLMADCQTTGGYPRMAQIAAVDLPLCGQLKPGDRINFKQITLREAERLYIEREIKLTGLAVTIREKYS